MTTPAPRTRWSAGPALLLAATMALTACGEDLSPGTTDPSQSPTGATVVEVLEDVEYYGACGNEVLHHGDLVYYPLLPEEREDFDPEPYAMGLGMVLPAVAPPGPGDDTGTLTIYADGYARFESDSGRETWLTEEERDYNWVC